MIMIDRAPGTTAIGINGDRRLCGWGCPPFWFPTLEFCAEKGGLLVPWNFPAQGSLSNTSYFGSNLCNVPVIVVCEQRKQKQSAPTKLGLWFVNGRGLNKPAVGLGSVDSLERQVESLGAPGFLVTLPKACLEVGLKFSRNRF